MNRLLNCRIAMGSEFLNKMTSKGWIVHNGVLQRLNVPSLLCGGQKSRECDPRDAAAITAEECVRITSTTNWYRIVPTIHQQDGTSLLHDDYHFRDIISKNLLFVNKPSGMHCVPPKGATNDSASLACLVRLRYPQAKLCHRIDRDTSGVVVFGLTSDAHRAISQQFESRKVRKTYVALVYGHPTEEEGVIDISIGKVRSEEGFNRWVLLSSGVKKTREAKTKWKLETPFDVDGAKFSRIKLFPLTGRGHQLRIHMLALGHPILGDTLHAPQYVAAAAPRLCLHAHKLEIQYNGLKIGATSVAPF